MGLSHTARCSGYATVPQVSKPAVPPTSKSAGRVFEEHAGLETGDTADLEVCGTRPCRLSQRLGSKRGEFQAPLFLGVEMRPGRNDAGVLFLCAPGRLERRPDSGAVSDDRDAHRNPKQHQWNVHNSCVHTPTLPHCHGIATKLSHNRHIPAKNWTFCV